MVKTFDAGWLDAQYNNRARVADHEQVLARWAQASALTRQRASRRLDVRYGDGPNETLDLFPTARADAPVFVFIHGGYWRALDKSDVSFVAASFIADGALVVVPNYALCPSVAIDTIPLQLARALAWIWRNAALYGGDPSRIVVAGHSAGGHLAAMLLSCDWRRLGPDLPSELVSSALGVSGLYDLEPIMHTAFLQADLKLTPALVDRLSPALYPAPRGQFCAVVGERESEEFLRQNRLIRERWGADAVPVCETVAGTNHFTVLHELADPHAPLHGLALQLLGLAEPRPA